MTKKKRSPLLFIIPGVVLVLVIAAVAAFLFIGDDNTSPDLEVSDQDEAALECGDAAATPAAVDGEWTVAADCDSVARMRIGEKFAGGVKTHTAEGNTPGVTGSIAVAGQEISTASFTVDLTALEFTDAPPSGNASSRTNAMKDRGLETNEFPDATFELTEPIDLGAVPTDGKEVTVDATGDLTLHGVTNSVTFPVTALLKGDTIQIGTNGDGVDVALADYDIEKPDVPFVASIEDDGQFSFRIFLQQA